MPPFDITFPNKPLDFYTAKQRVQIKGFFITQHGWCADSPALRKEKFDEIEPYFEVIQHMRHWNTVYLLKEKIIEHIRTNVDNYTHLSLSCFGMDANNNLVITDPKFGHGELMLFMLSRGYTIDHQKRACSQVLIYLDPDLLNPRLQPIEAADLVETVEETGDEDEEDEEEIVPVKRAKTTY